MAVATSDRITPNTGTNNIMFHDASCAKNWSMASVYLGGDMYSQSHSHYLLISINKLQLTVLQNALWQLKIFPQLKLEYMARFLKLLLLDFVLFYFCPKNHWHCLLAWDPGFAGYFLTLWRAVITASQWHIHACVILQSIFSLRMYHFPELFWQELWRFHVNRHHYVGSLI